MNTYVSLLRGINVSGSNKILMAHLRELFTSLDFLNISTYLQSGNVVFSSNIKDESRIETQIKSKILDAFGYDISIMVYSKKSFIQVYKNNPFIENKNLDSKKLYTIFLNKIPDSELFSSIKNNANFPEEMILKNNIIYMYYVNGYGRSKVTNNYFEHKLSITATTRNWRTVTNLYNLLKEVN